MAYEPGDLTKFEIQNDQTGESEWMWLRIDTCDEPNRQVFGCLDSKPLVFDRGLKLGQRLALSDDNIREHKKASEFSLK